MSSSSRIASFASSRAAALAAALATTLLSSSALADDFPLLFDTVEPKLMSAQVQLELLPVGSAKTSAQGQSNNLDTAVAYGISASLNRDLSKSVRIGLTPRLIFNVISDDADDNAEADTELDLRASITAHFPLAPRAKVYASLTPGFSIVIPDANGVDSATGFALGAAVGGTYDLSPTRFVNAELGYQRAFTSTSVMSFGQEVDFDLDLSYMHVGLGAGTRF